MKKTKLNAIFALAAFTLTACAGDISQEQYTSDSSSASVYETENVVLNTEPDATMTEETTTPNLEIPHVTYDEILTGKYNEQNVYIDCVISNFSYSKITDILQFDAWILNGDSYFYDGTWLIVDISSNANLADLSTGENGDLYEFCVFVYEDGSFGGSSLETAKRTNTSIDLSSIEQQFKEACHVYACEEILRNPKSYSGQAIQLSGEVFQLVSENDSQVQFMLDTGEKNGYVYVQYKKNTNKERILEGDKVTAYGFFYKLYTYVSMTGLQKSVPELSAIFIDRQ